MPKNINLPTERVQQLEALGAKWDMTVADVVGKMIHQQIADGELTSDVPGFRITKDGKTVSLITDELNLRFSRKEYLADAAKSIRAILAPSKSNPLMPLPDGFGLARRGTSLKLQDTEAGTEKTLAPSIAIDVAEMLERAAESK